MGLALGMRLKFYTSVAKESKLKVRKFCELISTFLEVTGEKLIGGFLGPPPTWIGLKNSLSDMMSCSSSTQLITSDISVRYWPRIYSLNINFIPIGEIPTKGFPVNFEISNYWINSIAFAILINGQKWLYIVFNWF